jgi:hypothetical protein
MSSMGIETNEKIFVPVSEGSGGGVLSSFLPLSEGSGGGVLSRLSLSSLIACPILEAEVDVDGFGGPG